MSGPPRSQASGGLTPLEALGIIALLAVLTAGGLMWASGHVLVRASAGRWASADLNEAGAITARWLRDPGDPAAAWPESDASHLPGPIGYYAAFASLAVVPLLPGFLALRSRVRRQRDQRPPGARWATRKDLHELRVRRPVPGRITLGMHADAGLIAAERDRSVLVFGPTRSGKTTGLAIPAILEWDGPTIATSVKADLLADTIEDRRRRGGVHVFDPTGATGYEPTTWSPLEGCSDWQGAQRTAAWMTSAVKVGGRSDEFDFWYASAAKLLAPLLFAAATSGRAMRHVVSWIDTQEDDEVVAALREAGVPEAYDAFQATLGRHAQQRSSVYTTVETVVAAYGDPAVARSADGSAFVPRCLVEGAAGTLYVCSPREDQQRLRPLFVTLLQQTLAAAMRAAVASPGGRLQRSLLVVLDEAANVAPLRDLDQLASTAAGHGITLLTVFQDLAQARHRYGDAAQTIVNNHHAVLVLSGMKDLSTLDMISRLVGDTDAPRSTTSTSAGRRTVTQTQAREALLPPSTVRDIPRGQAIALCGQAPPTRLALRPVIRRKR